MIALKLLNLIIFLIQICIFYYYSFVKISIFFILQEYKRELVTSKGVFAKLGEYGLINYNDYLFLMTLLSGPMSLWFFYHHQFQFINLFIYLSIYLSISLLFDEYGLSVVFMFFSFLSY